MRPTPWTDTHDRLLAEAAPEVGEPSEADLQRIWRRVDLDDGATRRRRRVRVGVAAGIGAVVLGTSGLAVAERYSARTGEGPSDAEDLRLGGPGERLGMAAPDFGAVIVEETTDIPFPDDASRALALRQQVEDARGAQADEFVSTGAIRAWVADQAVCSWSNQWAAATRDGDEEARAEAIAMIQDAPGWPAVVEINTGQFAYLARLGVAVEGSEPAAVARVLAEHNGYCRAENVPDLPAADPLRDGR